MRRPEASRRRGAATTTTSFLFLLLTLLSSPAAVYGNAAEAGGTATAPNPGKLRASADEAFASGELDKAIKLLSQAIQLEPENEKNHYKRYRAHLRGKKYREALQDLSTSLTLDPENGAKLQQRAKLYKMLGRCSDAITDLDHLLQHGPTDQHTEAQEGLMEARHCHDNIVEAEKALSSEHPNYHVAKAHLDVAISLTEVAPDLLLRRANCNYHLRDYYAAAADTGRAIKLDGSNIPALELRGLSYYKLGEFDMAQTHFREGLKYDPEHKGCKEGHRRVKKMQKTADKGMASVDVGELDEGIAYYRDAIAVDPDHSIFNIPLLLRISRAYMRKKELGPAREAVDTAMSLDDGHIDTHLCLSEVLLAEENYDEAVRVLKQAHESFPEDQSVKDAIHKAEIALKQSKEINYYKVLGVDRRASTGEIKKAYRNMAKIYHPDKQADATDAEKEKAEREFLKIAEAYEVLGDEETRAKYDRGEDVSGQAQQAHHHNPFQHQGGFPFGGGGQQHFTFRFQ